MQKFDFLANSVQNLIKIGPILLPLPPLCLVRLNMKQVLRGLTRALGGLAGALKEA